MNKAKRLPSGNWRVQVYDYTDAQKKKHLRSFTAPTRSQAEQAAADFVKQKRTRDAAMAAGTVGALIDKYIQLAEPTLSPSTIIGYKRIRKNAFPDLMQVPASRLTPARVQQAINSELRRPKNKGGSPLSPKTIRSEWGLVSAALSELAGIRFTPRLPSYQPAPKTLPDPQAVMEAVKGTDIELPALLALCLGLRMSEIRGLRYSDLNGNVLTISRAVVDTPNGPVEKGTKTASSIRRLVLPQFLIELINYTTCPDKTAQNGCQSLVEPRHRSIIYRHFRKACSSHGIEMTFHNLRALNASTMLALGIPDKYAMERGGWASPDVMKRYYQQTLTNERRMVEQIVNEYYIGLYNSSDHSGNALSLRHKKKGSNTLKVRIPYTPPYL